MEGETRPTKATCRSTSSHLDQYVDQHVDLSTKVFFDQKDHSHNKIQILENNL